jgi:Raf kinase inhibitor-like YbhB/YbcL family protein
MKITSTAFKTQGIIPSRYTCEGDEINPPLHFSDIPQEAKSLVLIMDDPDVPKSLKADGMWDHWVLFNILPSVQKIEENTTPLCKSGMTTSGHTRYVGPCPPDREHRYFFKLYALDIMLNLPSGSTKKEVEKAMNSHILAQCELIGLYEKGKGY